MVATTFLRRSRRRSLRHMATSPMLSPATTGCRNRFRSYAARRSGPQDHHYRHLDIPPGASFASHAFLDGRKVHDRRGHDWLKRFTIC